MPLPRGFVPPCLPTKAPQPPTGGAWVYEIKHDGFRVVAIVSPEGDYQCGASERLVRKASILAQSRPTWVRSS